MGSAGLPALSGFVGEFLTLLGTFTAGPGPRDVAGQAVTIMPAPMLMGALATTGVILGAVYLLYMFQKVFFGKLDAGRNGHLKDLNGRELGVFVPLVVAIFLMGLFPRPFQRVMEPSVAAFVNDMKTRIRECDGPPHRYGQMMPVEGKCPAAGQAAKAPGVAQAAAAAPAAAAPAAAQGGAR
jgi:NADH-quinone oxidoreductase subunit M